MIASIATSKARTYGIPASADEIAALPVITDVRLDRALFQKIKSIAAAKKLTQQGLLRHLITTHPDMQEG